MNTIPEELELLATAHVIGQATPEQQAEIDQLLATDPVFRALVEDMEATLAPLNNVAPDVEPPAGLLNDIMAEIDAIDPPGATIANDNSASRTGGWKIATLAASLIAMVSTGLHLLPPEQSSAPADQLIALMSQEGQSGLVVIVYDPDAQKVVARLSGVSGPENGVWELWRIREGGAGPESLGVMPRPDESGRVELSLGEALSAQTDTLAISLEPDGGSIEAGPSGPVLFVGGVAEV